MIKILGIVGGVSMFAGLVWKMNRVQEGILHTITDFRIEKFKFPTIGVGFEVKLINQTGETLKLNSLNVRIQVWNADAQKWDNLGYSQPELLNLESKPRSVASEWVSLEFPLIALAVSFPKFITNWRGNRVRVTTEADTNLGITKETDEFIL